MGTERDGEVISCPGNDITTKSQERDGNILKLSILQREAFVRNTSGEDRPTGSTFLNPFRVINHFWGTSFSLSF
jgi:hypothetical protein